MSTADAVAREAAWLAGYDSSDGLPALLKSAGGPFDVVQGYKPRTPNQSMCGLYLRRTHLGDDRWTNQGKLPRYAFNIAARWYIGASTGSGAAEAGQAAFDAAIDLTIRRIRGTLVDHTHGGRFMSVAEAPAPAAINVNFEDPENTIPYLRAEITYFADDSIAVI